MKTYYMFGDSLMRGVMPDEAWNYHSSDAIGFEKMQAQYNMKFLNFAMPTFTSERVKMWLTQIMSSHPVPDAAFLECASSITASKSQIKTPIGNIFLGFNEIAILVSL